KGTVGYICSEIEALIADKISEEKYKKLLDYLQQLADYQANDAVSAKGNELIAQVKANASFVVIQKIIPSTQSKQPDSPELRSYLASPSIPKEVQEIAKKGIQNYQKGVIVRKDEAKAGGRTTNWIKSTF
ncbi:MAG TPA: hypothetical protein PLD88_00595, partial [Candidatus Berkiella sp.]|nr:hypothetical protein [Candidatus Berkiella sp.]